MITSTDWTNQLIGTQVVPSAAFDKTSSHLTGTLDGINDLAPGNYYTYGMMIQGSNLIIQRKVIR